MLLNSLSDHGNATPESCAPECRPDDRQFSFRPNAGYLLCIKREIIAEDSGGFHSANGGPKPAVRCWSNDPAYYSNE
jgi:hypothetical protein